MSHAIEVHVEEHRKKELDLKKANAEAERIEDLLIIQLFDRVGNE